MSLDRWIGTIFILGLIALTGFDYRGVIIFGGIYFLFLGFFWLCRHAPYTAIFIGGFLSGLLGGGRRRRW